MEWELSKKQTTVREHTFTIYLWIFLNVCTYTYITYLFKNTLKNTEREKQNQHISGLTTTDVASKQARPQQQPGYDAGSLWQSLPWISILPCLVLCKVSVVLLPLTLLPGAHSEQAQEPQGHVSLLLPGAGGLTQITPCFKRLLCRPWHWGHGGKKDPRFSSKCFLLSLLLPLCTSP